MALPRDDWDEHWSHYAESAERNPAQLYRRRLIFQRLPGNPSRLLDIGAGQGDFVADSVGRFPSTDVLGVEGSCSGVEVARSKIPRATFVQRDLLQTANPPPEHREWATDAVCSEVLEHVDDPVRLLRNSQDYMQPGCRLVVTVPGGPMSAFDRHIGHRKHYTKRDLRRVLQEAGFDVSEVRAAGFPFFNLYRLAVIVRGNRLIADVSSSNGAAGSRLADFVMASFRFLFTLNLGSTPWGWQIVATAWLPKRRAIDAH